MTNDNMHTCERRKRHAIRKIFTQACVLLGPSVISNDKSLNASSFAMVHMVQDHFPEITGSEAHIVIATVERLHREKRLQILLDEYACSQKT